jgi:hypothetical protein
MVAAANMVEIVALVGDTARGLAYAATRVARHPPHLSWPAWAARDLRHGTSRQASLIALMSALGHKRTFAVHASMSALGHKRTSGR